MKKSIQEIGDHQSTKMIILQSKELQAIKGGNNGDNPPDNTTTELPKSITVDGGEQ